VAFATPLKLALMQMLSVPYETFENRLLKEQPLDWLGLSPRDLMLSLGHEWGRAIDQDFWVKLMERNVSALLATGKSVVISDVRYPNEAEFVRRIGSLVHIDRPDLPRLDHESEAGVVFLPGDMAIANRGTFEDLRLQVSWLVSGDTIARVA
jgi:hypothetical protein